MIREERRGNIGCRTQARPAPVAIGGVGGSGTRLIAQLLMDLGYFMGRDLNESLDNLWFTLLFKRPGVLTASDEELAKLARIFVARMTGHVRLDPSAADLLESLAQEDRLPEFAPQWSLDRADSLINGTGAAPEQAWGWKEPNTHLVIARLRGLLPGLKYIHVMRNGLDMAYSANQNQLRLWGTHFIGQNIEITPYFSLKFWRLVHERILAVGNGMGEDFFLLNYDRFCTAPLTELIRMLEFLGIPTTPAEQARLIERVTPPLSIGRFKPHGIDVFDSKDVAFAAALGFDIQPD
jgi:hypothetical protein